MNFTKVVTVLIPLEDVRPHLYNPVTCQIAPAEVNVADSIVIGEKMEREYIAFYLMGSTILSVALSRQCLFSKSR